MSGMMWLVTLADDFYGAGVVYGPYPSQEAAHEAAQAYMTATEGKGDMATVILPDSPEDLAERVEWHRGHGRS